MIRQWEDESYKAEKGGLKRGTEAARRASEELRESLKELGGPRGEGTEKDGTVRQISYRPLSGRCPIAAKLNALHLEN